MSMLRARSAVAAGLFGVSLALAACGRDTPPERRADEESPAGVADGLTSRALFFDPPERTLARVSPDGQKVSWLAPRGPESGLWIAPTDDLAAARPVAAAPDAEVAFYAWAGNNTHMIYTQYDPATDQTRVFGVDVAGGGVVDLTPPAKSSRDRGRDRVSAYVVGLSLDYPDELLIAANDYDPDVYDVHRVNVVTGESLRVLRNAKGADKVHADARLEVRLLEWTLEDGGREAYVRDEAGQWRELVVWAAEDAALSRIIGFDAGGRFVYAIESQDRETAALVRYDVNTGERTLLGADARADVDAVTVHPATGAADAFTTDRLTQLWTPLTPETAEAFSTLRRRFDGAVFVTGRSLDDDVWSVFATSDRDPGSYHLFNRREATVTQLFERAPALAAQARSTRRPVVIKTPSGADIIAYLTIPADADADRDVLPDAPLPLVLMAPDGPWKRFHSGFERIDAFLADRGYAVLSVNARGARGFGKTHLNAVAGDWGGGVQDDLATAADWAQAKAVAPAGEIAVMGARLGGLAALSAVAEAPETFACAFALSPVADPAAFVTTLPVAHQAYARMLSRMVGDPRDPAVRAAHASGALAAFAAGIERPVLIIHGEADPSGQAPLSRAAALAGAEAGAPITFASFPDEPAYPMTDANSAAMAAAVEAFLAGCLGGEAAPSEAAIAASSLTVAIEAGGVIAKDAFANAPRAQRE